MVEKNGRGVNPYNKAGVLELHFVADPSAKSVSLFLGPMQHARRKSETPKLHAPKQLSLLC